MKQENLNSVDILLVEDSPADRLLTIEALADSKLANNLRTVEDGVEAMLFLRKQGKYKDVARPDLILLDLNLPKKDGREVLAEIKADPVLRLIPVVILSTSRSDEDVLKAYGLQANCYIVKPVDFAQFAKVVSSIEDFWFKVVTLPRTAVLQQLAHAQPSQSTSLQPVAAGQVLRILLLEDSLVDAMLLREALDDSTAAKFLVTHVERLSDARGKLQSEKFDVVMVDLNLPDSQGLETYRKMRGDAGDLPVIVLTGFDDEKLGMSALREGARDYLVKCHVTGRMLIRAVRYAIEYKNVEDQLRQAQRMEAIGQLAGGVAHDFNNILTIILGHIDLLSANLKSESEEVAESVHKISAAADRAASLTRQLLMFGRRQFMQIKPVEPNKVVGNITTMLRRILGENIRLEVNLAPALPVIEADVSMLEQIIMNLAVNALDAMPDGGDLIVQTTAVEVKLDGDTTNPEAYDGHFACLRFTDTGVGIVPEHLPRIFEPFFTTKDVGKGTGLGLATVHGIVRQHHGWVDVSSTVGMGTTFQIFLPASTSVLEAKPTPEDIKPRSGRETILIVEDEDGVRQIVRMTLRRQGYLVLEADSGKAALSVWANHKDHIALVFTDIVMPGGMSGHDLAKALLASKPDLKVVFTSGYDREIGQPGGHLIEGVNFLQKPYPIDQLLRIVRDRLDSD